MSDTLADMITRIRNGQKANKVSVKAIFSKLNVNEIASDSSWLFKVFLLGFLIEDLQN